MAQLKQGDIVVFEDKEQIVISFDEINEAYVLEDEDGEQTTVDLSQIEIVDESTDDDDGEQIDELTKAGETIKGKANWSTSQMVNNTIATISNMSPSDQTKFFQMVQDQYGSTKSWGTDSGDASKNKSSVDTKNPNPNTMTPGQMAGKVKSFAKEDLERLLQGTEGLSEDFKEQAATIFEAAVSLRVGLIQEELEELYDQRIQEEFAELTEQLESDIDQYMNYVAEQWIAENEVEIESTLRTEVSESFMADLFGLFKQYNFELPESQVDVVEELTARVEELEDKLNESINENMELVEAIEEFSAEEIFDEVAEGLAMTQTEKLRKLVEDIDFDGDLDAYKKKLTVVKEKFFAEDRAGSTLNEEVELEESGEQKTNQNADPNVLKYASAISKTIKR